MFQEVCGVCRKIVPAVEAELGVHERLEVFGVQVGSPVIQAADLGNRRIADLRAVRDYQVEIPLVGFEEETFATVGSVVINSTGYAQTGALPIDAPAVLGTCKRENVRTWECTQLTRFDCADTLKARGTESRALPETQYPGLELLTCS